MMMKRADPKDSFLLRETPDKHLMKKHLLLFLFLATFLLISILSTAGSVRAATGDEEEEEDSPHDLESATDEVVKNNFLMGIGLIAVISMMIYIPMAIRARHVRVMEDALPDVLQEIADNIRSGRSVESAFKEVADVRDDRLGNELKRASEEMLHTSFEAAMRAFAQRTGSRMIIRIISLVLIAVESGASLANVLEKISSELWKVYILKKDREAKSATNASVILWGGAALTPAIIGFILGIFGTQDAITLDMDSYENVFMHFLMMLGLISVIMHGVAMGTIKQDVIRSPFFYWLPGVTYIFVQEISGAFV